MSAGDIAEEIIARGTAFEPAAGRDSIPPNASDPAIAAAVDKAVHGPLGVPESDILLDHLSRAVELYHQHDYGNAIHAFQDDVNERSGADLFGALGSLFLASHDLDRAKQSFRRLAEIAEDCMYAHDRLASIYFSVEDVDNAEAEARKMLAIDPAGADARRYSVRARALRLQAEHAELQPYHEEIPSGDGVDLSEYENDRHQRVADEALHYNRAGLAKYREGDFESATTDFQHAISVEPRWWSPHNNLGLAYLQLGRFEDAIAAYQQAKAFSPKPLGVRFRHNLGYCLCQIHRWDEAIAEFEEILRMDPTWNQARPCLYKALKAVHRDRDAEQVYLDDKKYKAMGYDD
jgi:tetratricopeptide (TPR) repeat protein